MARRCSLPCSICQRCGCNVLFRSRRGKKTSLPCIVLRLGGALALREGLVTASCNLVSLYGALESDVQDAAIAPLRHTARSAVKTAQSIAEPAHAPAMNAHRKDALHALAIHACTGSRVIADSRTREQYACESIARFGGCLRFRPQRTDRLRIQPLDAHDAATITAGKHGIAVGTHQTILRCQADHARCGLQADARPGQLQQISLAGTGPDHHRPELVRVPTVQRREVEPGTSPCTNLP